MTTDEPARATGAVLVDRVALSPVGTRRVEDTLAWLMSVFGVLFSVQTLPGLVADWSRVATPFGLAQLVLVYGVIALAGLASVLRQSIRPVFWSVGGVFLVALLLWPLAIRTPLDADGLPWLVSLSATACGFVVVAARGWVVPVGYTLVVAGVTVLVRTSPPGGRLAPGPALLESAYNVVISLALLSIVVAMRIAARTVDRAQIAALGRYADTQVDEATESERTRTDALVHDSVLTTFLSAAASSTPDGRALAARMAQNTMNVLSRATVAAHVGPKVAVLDLVDRVRADAAGIGERFDFSVRQVRDHFVPESVADAVVSASVQAMTNSVKHAGGPEVPRSIRVEGTGAGGVRVIVADRGRGFDPDAVASERLGLRVSIMERMRRVGGEVDLTTAEGRGTVFVLSWPAAAASVGALPADAETVTA